MDFVKKNKEIVFFVTVIITGFVIIKTNTSQYGSSGETIYDPSDDFTIL
jgi:hypothetical protein